MLVVIKCLCSFVTCTPLTFSTEVWIIFHLVVSYLWHVSSAVVGDEFSLHSRILRTSWFYQSVLFHNRLLMLPPWFSSDFTILFLLFILLLTILYLSKYDFKFVLYRYSFSNADNFWCGSGISELLAATTCLSRTVAELALDIEQ